ncbi:MAG: hypothetical protein KAG97_09395, partial [Victivallales bacterium]|nr:hypothetical protein [Victivallales bacterium]
MRDKKIVLNWDMDCHTHTSYSDCCEDVTIEKLKKKAGEIDLDFAVTDHSAHLYFPREIVWCMMTEAFPMLFEFYRTEGRRNIEKYITTLRKNGVTVGLELDIYTDETLVFEDDLFQELDIVVGSLHVLDALQRKKECATVVDEFKRLTLALLASNRIDILGHPFRILSRAGIRIENELIQWVVDQCGIYDVALEINSHY